MHHLYTTMIIILVLCICVHTKISKLPQEQRGLLYNKLCIYFCMATYYLVTEFFHQSHTVTKESQPALVASGPSFLVTKHIHVTRFHRSDGKVLLFLGARRCFRQTKASTPHVSSSSRCRIYSPRSVITNFKKELKEILQAFVC